VGEGIHRVVLLGPVTSARREENGVSHAQERFHYHGDKKPMVLWCIGSD
jgi:hypothetical protein